jgi:hypothetical protein
MPQPVRKDARWNSVVANARAIRGALEHCLKLSDQLNDGELKGEAIGFVNEMEYLATKLAGESTRIRLQRSTEKELVNRLREEVAHIRQLLEENDRIAHELGDGEATKLLFTSITRLNQFARLIEEKR